MHVIKRIESRDNPRFKALLKLGNSARERRARSAALLDGPHLIEAYAAAGGRARALVASDGGLTRPEIARLFEDSDAAERVVLSDRLFRDIASVVTPAGIVALIDIPEHEPVLSPGEDCVLLDGIQDAGNVGSILRSAAAAGVRHVFLSTGCAFGWSAKVLRAGMGAHFHLAIHERAPLGEIARRFDGLVIVTDARASRSLYEIDPERSVAWIFGNEGAGVSPEVAAAANLRVRIPMTGRTESINVAAAAAVCLFERARRRRA